MAITASSKSCSVCRRTKSLEDFSPQVNGPQGRRSACKSCQAQKATRIRLHDPVAHRWRVVKSRYGISREDYAKMYASQKGCAICGRDCNTRSRDQEGTLCIDHDHVTGVIRGLLCHECNLAIAYLDTVEKLEAAIAYLQRGDDLSP